MWSALKRVFISIYIPFRLHGEIRQLNETVNWFIFISIMSINTPRIEIILVVAAGDYLSCSNISSHAIICESYINATKNCQSLYSYKVSHFHKRRLKNYEFIAFPFYTWLFWRCFMVWSFSWWFVFLAVIFLGEIPRYHIDMTYIFIKRYKT